MMTQEQTKIIMYEEGRRQALALQDKSATMTGTELNAEDNHIPEFLAAKSIMNMLERPIGFVCKSSAGRVVKLVQPYDSEIFSAEPEELPAQWGFVWSDDPLKAKPFISLATSPYMIGNCCVENEQVYRSIIDNNTWAPSVYAAGWEVV
jgi:hypothetical protein